MCNLINTHTHTYTHTYTHTVPYLLVADLVHELEALDRLLLGDADVLLLQGHRPVRVVEVEQSLLGVDLEESSHVLVVGQGGRQPDDSHKLLQRNAIFRKRRR